MTVRFRCPKWPAIANLIVLKAGLIWHLKTEACPPAEKQSKQAYPRATIYRTKPTDSRMAIFHLDAKVISRGKGQSAIAAAAYRSGERLRDEQTGEQKYYPSRAERIVFTEIMAPKNAPEWAYDRSSLWNHAEGAEKRKDAQLAREFEISLPHELTDRQREWLIKDYAREQFVRRGYAVDIAIHAPEKDSDDRNHHAHVMVTMRTLGPEGFVGNKDRTLNTASQLEEWRAQWAHLANRHLERHGHEARIDHRSLKDQGIDREPGIHLGYAAHEMAARGAQSDRMDELREILARNDIRLDLKKLEAELKALEREQARQNVRDQDSAPGERRRRGAPAAEGTDWTDRAGLVAQQRSAQKWVKDGERAERAAGGLSAGKRAQWAEGREKSKEAEREAAKKRPDKDNERDR